MQINFNEERVPVALVFRPADARLPNFRHCGFVKYLSRSYRVTRGYLDKNRSLHLLAQSTADFGLGGAGLGSIEKDLPPSREIEGIVFQGNRALVGASGTAQYLEYHRVSNSALLERE